MTRQSFEQDCPVKPGNDKSSSTEKGSASKRGRTFFICLARTAQSAGFVKQKRRVSPNKFYLRLDYCETKSDSNSELINSSERAASPMCATTTARRLCTLEGFEIA